MASKSTASMGLTLGAIGAASIWAPAAVQAFVAPSASPSAPQLRGATDASQQTSSPAGHAAAATAVGTVAVMLAASSRRSRTGVARRAEATGVTDEKPFAGGLIGGESAFAGQDFNFDPLGLSVKCEKYLPWFRESELKHGRIAMLAFVGLVVPEIVRIPGDHPCYAAKTVVDAHNACAGNPPGPFLINTGDFFAPPDDQAGPLFQVYAFCGLIEMLTTFAKTCNVSNKPGLTLENAGDYQLGVNFLPSDPAKVKEMKLKELKNGRLAMLAFGGAITQATLTGNGFPWLYAQKESTCALSSSVSKATGSLAAGRSMNQRGAVARQAGYKMSAAVPFLPMSPALEGIPGEEEGFDPMGFSLAFEIGWLREAELKHGRVAMLATVGWITTDLGLRVPGDAFQVSTIEAHDAMVKFGGMPQILIWCGLLEVLGLFAYVNMREGKTDRKPGDFGLRGFYPSDPKGQYDMQVKELRNGRLAMLAYSGIVTSAVLTQDKWPFFDVQVSAVAKKDEARIGSAFCGAVAPTPSGSRTACQASSSKSLPFLPKPQNLGGLVGGEAEFDPLGFSDVCDIKWLRESELKHGRVCMLACVGFVAEQYWQLPGFEGAPDALQAVYTAPLNASGVLLFLCGYIESAAYGGKITMLDMFEGDGASRAPGDLNFGKRFLPVDKAAAEEMAVKELTNGRLAMLAFSGMVHHNLVVKGPLFPLFPEGYVGPQGSWDLDSVAGALNSGRMGL
ncbi:LHC Ib-21 [Symbiodinium pilosum]|uniref:LHC Ib-21 protein n=1 Tax=Symbiodinium pilosum TaxID=2952 RepID=A0A812ULH9_SYMPI|nr:LHC Ib-21 [Symbiodinium pilosum]